MQYQLTGYYYHILLPNSRGELLGKIEVKKDGSFESEITNSSSKFPNQAAQIKGFFRPEKGLIKLIFTESQLDPQLAATKLPGMTYSLEKKGNEYQGDKYLRGIYEGFYSDGGGQDRVEISIF